MSLDPAANGSALARRIESQADFVVALHDTVALAGQGAVRRMVWVDPDFADWPLDDEALWPRLIDWLRLPQRNEGKHEVLVGPDSLPLPEMNRRRLRMPWGRWPARDKPSIPPGKRPWH